MLHRALFAAVGLNTGESPLGPFPPPFFNQVDYSGFGAGIELGSSVAADYNGTRFVAGAPNNLYYGTVVIYKRTGNLWYGEGVLTGTTRYQGSKNGTKVSMSDDGSVVVSGAPEFNDNNSGSPGGIRADAGAFYVFERSGTTWSQVLHVMNPATAPTSSQWFGYSVKVSGDGNHIVVGAPRWDLINPFFSRGGLTYYKRIGGVWTYQSRTFNVQNGLGNSIALNRNGTYLAASTNSSTIIYTNSGSTWTTQASIPTVGAEMAFNEAADMLAIAFNTNVVAIYRRSGSTWTFDRNIVGVAPPPWDNGGVAGTRGSVSMNYAGTSIVLGVPGASTSYSTYQSGWSAVFDLDATTGNWTQVNTLTGTGGFYNRFGHGVAMSGLGNFMVIGEPWESDIVPSGTPIVGYLYPSFR